MVPPDKPLGDGCGDESTDRIVPDGYVGFDFSSPCEKHDICYGTCRNTKSGCDINFYLAMSRECIWPSDNNYIRAGLLRFNFSNCKFTAEVYYIAVVLFGKPAYCEAQAKNCPECEPIPGCES